MDFPLKVRFSQERGLICVPETGPQGIRCEHSASRARGYWMGESPELDGGEVAWYGGPPYSQDGGFRWIWCVRNCRILRKGEKKRIDEDFVLFRCNRVIPCQGDSNIYFGFLRLFWLFSHINLIWRRDVCYTFYICINGWGFLGREEHHDESGHF